MTANQIAYWNLQETKRANEAKEAENYRSNTAREKETERSNRASEANKLYENRVKRLSQIEDERSNRAKELETNRSNLAKEAETTRHNLQAELDSRMNAYANLYDLDSIPAAVVATGDSVLKGITSGEITTLQDAVTYISDALANDPTVSKEWKGALTDAVHTVGLNVLTQGRPFIKVKDGTMSTSITERLRRK